MPKKILYDDKPWLKFYDEGVPATIKYQELCIPDLLENSAREFLTTSRSYFREYKVTYRELRKWCTVCDMPCFVRLKKGERVAILLPNMIPTVVAYYAVSEARGHRGNEQSSLYNRELEYQFNDSGSTVLVTVDLLANRMIELRPKTSIRQIVYTSLGDYLPFPKNLLFPLVAKKKGLAADVNSAPDVYKWRECIANFSPNPPEVKIKWDDVAVYQYTGGTTGVSKGAMLTHKNLTCMVQMYAAWFKSRTRQGNRHGVAANLS
jgi:long-chain acyl-CoA synthetase